MGVYAGMGWNICVCAQECAKEWGCINVCMRVDVCKDEVAHVFACALVYKGMGLHVCACTWRCLHMGVQGLHMGLCKGRFAQVWACKWMWARRALHTRVQKH